jgi:hypothetical protein
VVVGKSAVLGSAAIAQAFSGISSSSSTQRLFSQQGFPTRITVISSTKMRGMTTSSNSSTGRASAAGGGCDIKGFKVEHVLVRISQSVICVLCVHYMCMICVLHVYYMCSIRVGENQPVCCTARGPVSWWQGGLAGHQQQQKRWGREQDQRGPALISVAATMQHSSL